MKSTLLASTILLALVSAMPTAVAAAPTPFSGQLTFNYGVCADPTTYQPLNPCEWWKYAWVGSGPNWGQSEVVHLRGIHGTWTLSGSISGEGEITNKNADILWGTWVKTMGMPAVPEAFQSYAFQAWGTMDGYALFVMATVHNGQIYYSMFEMKGQGTLIQGTVTAVNWNTSTATLEGWMVPAP